MASVLIFVILAAFAFQTAWTAKAECYMKKADILFIMDESGSIKAAAFKDQKTFITRLIDNYNIGPDGTKVALISFGSKPRPQFEFKMLDDKERMKSRVLGVKQEGGGTYTWLALDMGRQRSFTEWGGSRLDEPTIPKITIIITDGNSQEAITTKIAARKLRKEGIIVFAIGVGQEKDISQKELVNIAGDPSRVFRVRSYDKLKNIENLVLNATCVTTEPPPTLPPINIYSTCEDKKADVLFLMDLSENAQQTQVDGMKDFLGQMVFKLDVSADKTRVGLITYGTSVTLQFGFGQYTAQEDMYQSIMAVTTDLPPAANLVEALKMANQQNFNPDKGGRTKIAKVVVIITTGKSSDSAQSVQMARQLIDDRGVKIIAIAVESASMKELSSIAGADNIVQVANANGLRAVGDQVAARICETNPPPNDFACGELRGIDLAFVMNTQSAGGHDMVYASEFMQKASDEFEIGPDRVQVSVVPARCRTLPGFELNRFSTKPELIQGMSLKKQESIGNLMTQVTNTTFAAANGARSKDDVNQVIVIVTDGTPDQASIAKAQQAKADGIEVFVVGVGKKVNSKALAQMASEPAGTHVFGVRTYEELVSDPKVVDGITTTICHISSR